MISLEFVYILMGVMMAGVSIVNVRDRSNPRWAHNAAFWALYAVTFLAGSHLPAMANGILVIAMVLIAATGQLGGAPAESTTPGEREASAARWGNTLFVPALTIPAVTVLGTFTLGHIHLGGRVLVDPKQVTLISLGLATVVALIEAECMGRVLEHPVWRAWMDRFLPRLVDRQPETLFAPVSVSDRSDGKIAHLDGLNLSRAWCWRSIAGRWNPDDPRRAIALETAERHLAVSLPHVAGDYAGEHWLATYAMLAALVRSP
jgi:hypothetical protein